MTDQASVAVADELAPPSQPHRLSTSCDVHPNERFSGFCPSCLCERLSVLDAPPQPPSSSRKPPNISAATLKALFKPSSISNNNNNSGNGRVKSGFFPELRRSKSFSAKNNEGFSCGVEPQRRSCDVRLRDEHRNVPEATVVVSGGKIEDDARKSSVSETVFEVNEEEEDEPEIEEEEEEIDSGEIVEEKTGEIVEEEEESKPIKDYIDLYPQTKKPSLKDFAGGFWSAAKKLQKWRQKQKSKKQRSNDDEGGKPHFPVKKKQFRDTQSEIGDYGFGRKSSDTDPRFSLDAGRFSVDINRISLDEPRASWDGYLIGGKTPLPPAIRVPPPPSMLSVVENAPVNQSDPPSPSINPINRESESDPIIIIPGGSNQTREYYNTEPPSSSSRRRKSLDRSNSIRKIITELDEAKSASNSKVSPAMTITDMKSRTMRDEYSIETSENKGNHIGDKKSRRWGKDVATELDEVRSVSNSKVSPAMTIDSNSMETESAAANKKSRRWSKWSILGFIYKKGANKDEEEEEDRYSRSNSTGMVEERSISESWSELRNGGPQMRRSNSNVSWRSSGGGGGGSTRNSKRYSSSKDGENGMLRFYLTPMRSSWRTGSSNGGGGGSGGGSWEKTAAKANSHGHSIARRVMRLY